jgi:AcrR family transcriptional regulator
MTSLREDKKLETQIRILESAKKVFTEKGYKKASMAEIAKRARVGAGTIYNYFPSKGALLLIIFSKEFEQVKNRDVYKPNDVLKKGLVDTIIKVLKELTLSLDRYPKSFLREILHALTEEAEENIQLRRVLFSLDEEMMGWFSKLIKENSKYFQFPINPEDAAYTIYSIAITDTLLYIYDENMSCDRLLEQITRHIQFLFIGKINQKSKKSNPDF